ncbi:uncharacterized protein LY89DRAFT_47224 [Mollisia scopiformis]|uniref:Zn(2)-C6 fungal-type domain-containing protein n=1 Tax=Mollisia scopiformis TaxID=149040 RepID=A0A194XE12_MOLSC|nr:uncharacterized protein LY89DRAFT_47224 [Mollisia scopiformis]KUJ18389.1 hypothetical protein LY89DRAFT_47224 [Mollisia scopiformis]
MPEQADSRTTRPVYLARKTYKRPYRKSTTGCKACKSRKIKCDEVRPACTNCRKRFIDPSCCQYVSPAVQKKTPPQDPDISSSSSSSLTLDRLVTNSPIGVKPSSLLELRLMHHYTRSTCGRQPLQYMCSPTTADSMWEVDIPKLAFSNEVVLSAMLGIAAFNLLSLSPNDRELAVASRYYFNQAIVKQRDAVSRIDRQNAEPLLVSAVLLAHQNWLYSYSEEAQVRGVDLSTYKMCRGASLLAEKASPWTSQYDFLSQIVLKLKEEGTESEYDAEFMAKVHEDMDTLIRALDDRGINTEGRLVYEAVAADVINTCSFFASGRAENSALEQQIVTVLHRVPPPFISLLENDDPIAMALMARNLALLGVLKDNSAWWVHGAGKNNVTETALRAITVQMPPEYMWTMDFPYKVFAKEVKVL